MWSSGVVCLLILLFFVQFCKQEEAEGNFSSTNATRSQRLTLISAHPRGFNFQPNNSLFGKNHWWSYYNPTTTTTTTTSTTAKPTITKFHHRPHHRHNSSRTASGLKSGRHVCVENKLTKEWDVPGHTHNCVGHSNCSRHIVYKCCPGWEQITKLSRGCNRPICKSSCQNGGKCVRPETCKCREGWTGRQCQLDINECKELKPCDQQCFNTEGSYYCTCREGFLIQSDRQSCKKIGNHVALEAGELDTNDIDYEEINHRLTKLEKSLHANSYMGTHDTISNLKSRIELLERKNDEMVFIQEKLKSFEMHAKKMDHLVDLLYKCRRFPDIYCPYIKF